MMYMISNRNKYLDVGNKINMLDEEGSSLIMERVRQFKGVNEL
jgi:hypothetical protein